MILLIVLSFFADSIRADTTKADTLMLQSAFVQSRMQKARIDTKLDSILVQLKNKAVLQKVQKKVKK